MKFSTLIALLFMSSLEVSQAIKIKQSQSSELPYNGQRVGYYLNTAYGYSARANASVPSNGFSKN